jgi:hypothetical protein
MFADRLGYLYGKNKPAKGHSENQGLIEASILGLTALLLSFTFNLSATKFEERRKIIVEEANNIGTAILRCDLYPDSVRTPMMHDFQKYVETRISYYEAGDDEQKISEALRLSDIYAGRIWNRTATYALNSNKLIPTSQMVPALNNMIDIVTTRDASRKAIVPPVIFMVLGLLLMISAFLLGYKQKERRRPVHVYAWAIMVSLTLYVMIELERPRRGILHLDNDAQKLVDLRKLFIGPVSK